MSASDELLTLAELAIGLAGFSGVVAAFAYRGRLNPIDRARFIALFSTALATAVLAFVPSILFQAGFEGEGIWRRASGVFLVWALGHGAVIIPRLRRAAIRELAQVSRRLVALMLGLTFLNLALQLGNLLGWPIPPGPVPYLVGLLIWLVFAAFFFAFLVLLRPGAASPDAG